MSRRGSRGIALAYTTATITEHRRLLKNRTPFAGLAENATAPSQDAMRRSLAVMLCPFCGSGPWKNLGGHTIRVHGLSAAEVKEMAGLLKGDPLCSPELSEKFREMGRGKRLPESAYTKARKPRTYSTAGLEVQRAKAAKGRLTAGTPRPDAAAADRARRARTQRLAANVWPTMDAEVLQRFNAGEFVRDIAAAMGIALPTVKAALRRSGVVGDLRGRATGKRDHSALRRGHEVSLARVERQSKAKVARFHELGGDWQALCSLAEEIGQDRKTVRALLVKYGVAIDGRRDKPHVYTPQPQRRKPPVACRVEGCEANSHCRGMCSKHYQRARRGAP